MTGYIRVLLIMSSALGIAPTVLGASGSVDIVDFNFAPKTLTITVGDEVQWTNQGSFDHTTTSNSTSAGTAWDSGHVAPGASFSHVFSREGSFRYHCDIHPNMKGTIVVEAAKKSRQQIGKDIIRKWVPIKLDLKGKNPSQVYLGSYIVNAQAGCANCHSCPTYQQGHNPYLDEPKLFNATSYLAGGTVVHGGGLEALSANLTPDAVTHRPANLSLKAFKNLLRTGHDPDVPGALLPVMPWPIFGMMGDADLDAVYEYLRSIPTAEMPAKPCAEPGQ